MKATNSLYNNTDEVCKQKECKNNWHSCKNMAKRERKAVPELKKEYIAT